MDSSLMNLTKSFVDIAKAQRRYEYYMGPENPSGTYGSDPYDRQYSRYTVERADRNSVWNRVPNSRVSMKYHELPVGLSPHRTRMKAIVRGHRSGAYDRKFAEHKLVKNPSDYGGEAKIQATIAGTGNPRDPKNPLVRQNQYVTFRLKSTMEDDIREIKDRQRNRLRAEKEVTDWLRAGADPSTKKWNQEFINEVKRIKRIGFKPKGPVQQSDRVLRYLMKYGRW